MKIFIVGSDKRALSFLRWVAVNDQFEIEGIWLTDTHPSVIHLMDLLGIDASDDPAKFESKLGDVSIVFNFTDDSAVPVLLEGFIEAKIPVINMNTAHALISSNENSDEISESTEKTDRFFDATMVDISNEFRQTVNRVISYANLIAGTHLDEIQKGYSDAILEHGKILLSVLDDITDIASPTTEEGVHAHVNFDLEMLIDDVRKKVASRHKTIRITFEGINFERSSTIFNGDASRIRHILLRLLSQLAREHPRGFIHIKVLVDDTIGLKDDIQTIVINVHQDHSASDIPSYRFQGSHEISRRHIDLQERLLTLKGLIRKLNGTFQLINTTQESSDWQIKLKMKAALPLTKTKISPLPKTDLKSKSVYIIDPDSVARKYISELCEQVSMTVMGETDSAEGAIEMLNRFSNHPDIIISELNLPDLSGYELVKKLKGVHPAISTKYIAITFRPLPGMAWKSEQSGFNVFLGKPIIADDFFRVVRTMLGDARGAGQIITRHFSQELALKGMRILIAENDPAHRRMLETILKRWGVSVHTTASSDGACEKIKQHSYDILIVDSSLKKDGAFTTIKRIQSESLKRIQYIITTLDEVVNIPSDLEKDSICGCLQKPFDIQLLKEHILKCER